MYQVKLVKAIHKMQLYQFAIEKWTYRSSYKIENQGMINAKVNSRISKKVSLSVFSALPRDGRSTKARKLVQSVKKWARVQRAQNLCPTIKAEKHFEQISTRGLQSLPNVRKHFVRKKQLGFEKLINSMSVRISDRGLSNSHSFHINKNKMHQFFKKMIE